MAENRLLWRTGLLHTANACALHDLVTDRNRRRADEQCRFAVTQSGKIT
jgi:hypothetical protein